MTPRQPICRRAPCKRKARANFALCDACIHELLAAAYGVSLDWRTS